MSHCANDNRDAFTYTMAQLDPKVGDLKANYDSIKKAHDRRAHSRHRPCHHA